MEYDPAFVRVIEVDHNAAVEAAELALRPRIADCVDRKRNMGASGIYLPVGRRSDRRISLRENAESEEP